MQLLKPIVLGFLALTCSVSAGRLPQTEVLRIRGGADVAAEFGRSQAPLKRQGAFKIARVLSQAFDQIQPSVKAQNNLDMKYGDFSKKLAAIGYKGAEDVVEGSDDPFLTAYVNLKLAACGEPPVKVSEKEQGFLRLVEPILKTYQEQQHVMIDKGLSLCPVDQRIQNYLNSFLDGVDGEVPKLPVRQLKIDRHGLSRLVSLPKGEDHFKNPWLNSYRISQGVVHNPKSDKRTTKGVFHVVDDGLPVSADKKLVPRVTFKRMLEHALNPPEDLHTLPYTSNQDHKTKIFCSLMLRPLACPEVEGFTEEKTSEVRFFVPGSCVSNLDFVESVFGNGDSPDLAENDAALDPEHWTGTTGAVILAPHLIRMKGKDMGLPHKSEANERQLKEGMYYEKDDDLYNGGGAFKLCARDARGVVVTIIADNYFGYCKKEVKTQLGFAANIYGQMEEEHAGGCIAFPSYDLGGEFDASSLGKAATKETVAFRGSTHKYLTETESPRTYKQVMELLKDTVEQKPEGYAIDKQYPDIVYVPEDTKFSIKDQTVSWKDNSINLKPRVTYMLPNGYKVEMVKKGSNSVVTDKKSAKGGQYERWRLKGTVAEGANLHKPATVSGGGKSEISKRLLDMIKVGPVFCNNVEEDFDVLQEIFTRDYSNIMSDKSVKHPLEESGVKVSDIKSLLDSRVSFGIIIKLLSPYEHYTAEHNEFIESIPAHRRELLAVIKQNYKPEFGDNWRAHFHTDAINGELGHELKFDDDTLLSSFIRIGYRSPHDKTLPLKNSGNEAQAWKTFTLRQDFFPADKLQTEDDITASVVVPLRHVKGLNYRLKGRQNDAMKFSQNVEFRLFQRPDDAIHRGYDKTTELDMSRPGCFISNFEPMQREEIQKIVDDTVGFEKFTEPMQDRLLHFLESAGPEFVVSSAHPRLVDGKPTKNPRYLQDSMEVTDPRAFHLGQQGARLARMVPLDQAIYHPVNSYLCGRRNNGPDAENGIPALAVHNPLHFYELPELFMELTSSMTGKSPSTTGAGSEGALTKGPFNMLNQIHDLNNALVSIALGGYDVFISSAGVIGPHKKIEHDFSLLIPEVWSRMTEEERSAEYLIKNNYLDKVEDMEIDGKNVPAHVVGYRINANFVKQFLGRVLSNPVSAFEEEMLKPELQDPKIFADGIQTITDTNKRVANMYLSDGGIDMAVPPLKALLHIMATGEYEGKTIQDPAIRDLFKKETILASDWYKERLTTFQKMEANRLKRGIEYLESFVGIKSQEDWKGKQLIEDLQLQERIDKAKAQLKKVEAASYLKDIEGSMGVDPAIYNAKGNNYDIQLPVGAAK